ncbi:MAG: hypothetical protein Rubg2KO_28160 [Rubricoccaceae bacterium]
MLRLAVPVLHVASSMAAEALYSLLGFKIESTYRPADGHPDPCYLTLSRDNARIHLSSFPGDGVPGSVVNLYVTDVDAIHDELTTAGLTADLAPTDQSWGTREVYIADPDGNKLRFVQASAS